MPRKEAAVSRVVVLALVLAAGVAPAAVSAQAVPTDVPVLKRRDATFLVGWARDHHPDRSARYPSFDALAGAATGGYYWTDHIKVEMDVSATRAATNPGTSDYQVSPRPPIVSTSRSASWTVRTTRVSGLLVFQAFRNVRFHPFAGVGLGACWETWRGATDELVYERGSSGSPPVLVRHTRADVAPDTRVRVSGVGVAGLKAYVSALAYVRVDVKVRAPVDGVVWRIGAGFDF
jgi:hypothetical protein